ncbi:MAG: helix-turn-helix domain-containing protein [Solirubrobacterales bacterium]|nr:helix-turn-helix domain-containing protein [Solirubrobacterales bacterium]
MATEARRQPPRTDPTTAGESILDDLLTSQEIAAMLQLRPSTVEDYARRGVLPSLKLGRHRRFLRPQVEQAIAALADRGGRSY